MCADQPKVLKNIESLVNRLLACDPEALHALAKLADRVILLKIQPAGFNIYIVPTKQGLSLKTAHDQAAEVTIEGTLFVFLGMLKSAKFGAGNLTMSGDVGLAQQFQLILKSIEIDYEEHLASITGDPIAHKLGNVFAAAGQLFQETGRTLIADVSEYFIFEKQILLDKSELAEYTSAVDHLRDRVARLQQRIQRLEKSRP